MYPPEEACVWKRKNSYIQFQSGYFSSCVLWLEESHHCLKFWHEHIMTLLTGENRDAACWNMQFYIKEYYYYGTCTYQKANQYTIFGWSHTEEIIQKSIVFKDMCLLILNGKYSYSNANRHMWLSQIALVFREFLHYSSLDFFRGACRDGDDGHSSQLMEHQLHATRHTLSLKAWQLFYKADGHLHCILMKLKITSLKSQIKSIKILTWASYILRYVCRTYW